MPFGTLGGIIREERERERSHTHAHRNKAARREREVGTDKGILGRHNNRFTIIFPNQINFPSQNLATATGEDDDGEGRPHEREKKKNGHRRYSEASKGSAR